MSIKLPAYTYLPGHWPHPTRDPDGHAYNAENPTSDPLNLLDWHSCSSYRRGILLFNHGYYWEAHEAWEEVWKLHKRNTAQAQFLQGLIKVAAAAIKIRQGHAKACRSLLTQSAKHFQKVMDKHLEKFVGGLYLKVLERWCRDFRDEVSELQANPKLPVEQIFPAFKLNNES